MDRRTGDDMVNITTEQMIDWAEFEGKRARVISSANSAKGFQEIARSWDHNSKIAYATAERLRMVRSMSETLRPE